MAFGMKKGILLALLSVQGASAGFLETRELHVSVYSGATKYSCTTRSLRLVRALSFLLPNCNASHSYLQGSSDGSSDDEPEECYPLTSSQSCSNEAVCEPEPINGHTYYTVHKWHDDSCKTKCAAEVDLDFLLSASEGYSCGKCEDGDDLPPTFVETCYIIDDPPQLACLDEQHTCDTINGHKYYKVHLPSPDPESDSCETKCVAQSDLDFLRREGYECGFCDSTTAAPPTPEPTAAAPTAPEPTTAAPNDAQSSSLNGAKQGRPDTGTCMGDDSVGFVQGVGSVDDLQCTAEDVKIATVRASEATTCTPGTTMEGVQLYATLESTSNQRRSDIGIWVTRDK